LILRARGRRRHFASLGRAFQAAVRGFSSIEGGLEGGRSIFGAAGKLPKERGPQMFFGGHRDNDNGVGLTGTIRW
jgi:hypothetical protein